MQENYKDYEFCIKVALDNAKKRINLLDNSDKKIIIPNILKILQYCLILLLNQRLLL